MRKKSKLWLMSWLILSLNLCLNNTIQCQQIPLSGNSSGDIIIIEGDTFALIPIPAIRVSLFVEDNLREQVSVQQRLIHQKRLMIAGMQAIIHNQEKTNAQYVLIVESYEEKEKIYETRIKELERRLWLHRNGLYIVTGLGLLLLIIN